MLCFTACAINTQQNALYGKNIFFVQIKVFEEILIQVELIHAVEFKKKYPDTIKVKILEEDAIAFLNKKGSKFVITESSKLIPFKIGMPFKNLPSAFGEDSEIYLSDFLKILKKRKFPTKRIKNFYFFKIGRWDIELFNDQVIKFPYKNINQSIDRSIKLLKRKDFEKYKVIDLRINDKIITE